MVGKRTEVIVHRNNCQVCHCWVPIPADSQGITFFLPDANRTDVYMADNRITDGLRNPSDYFGKKNGLMILRTFLN